MPCGHIVVEKVMNIRCYRELKRLKTFEDRYNYLRLFGVVGESTFGYDRYLNQSLYCSKKWKTTRDKIIIRDNGCDLGMDGYEIRDKILIHHIEPITIEDVEFDRDILYDPENLIVTTLGTHNAIHYGDEKLLHKKLIVRIPNDTCPWK